MFFLKLNTMKKNLFWMMAAVLFCGLTTCLTSCGDDDDPKPQPTPVEVSRTFIIKVEADKIEGLPVRIAFYDAAGNIQVETMSGSSLEKSLTYDMTKAGNIGFLVSRMIVNTDGLEDSENYNLKLKVGANTRVKLSDGTERDYGLMPNIIGYVSTLNGAGIKTMQGKGWNFFGYSYAAYHNDKETYGSLDPTPLKEALNLKEGTPINE